MNSIEIFTLPVSPFATNCIILNSPAHGNSILIDPGGNPDKIIEQLDKLGGEVSWVILTHAHFDHCEALTEVVRRLEANGQKRPVVAMHPGDTEIFEHLDHQSRLFGLSVEPSQVEITHQLQSDEEIETGGITLRVLHTPGHSPGSCSLYLASEKVVIVGDTLFARGVGRTDLPGGNTQQLISSITETLFSLPDETEVISGHGPRTTIGSEKRENPFLVSL